MNRRIWVTLLACAGAILPAAQAGAQEVSGATDGSGNDRGQVIATFYYSRSERGFDADGQTIDIADYDKLELYVLAEYRLTDELTLLFKPSLRDVSVEGGDDSSGFGYTDIGARYRFAAGEDWSLAVEGTARIPGVDREDSIAQVGSTDAEYDLRLRGFHSFTLGEDSAFIDLQGSYRLRDGDPPDEFHADITLGYRPIPDLLLMAQSFSTISDGRGQGIFDSYEYHNVQLSAVKQVSPGVSLQAGWVGTIDGKNALRERGVFGGVWISF